MSPPITKRTTNLKTKNNQDCQKTELYGSLITKELKKKHSSTPVGGMEIGSHGGEDSLQDGSWKTGVGRVASRPGSSNLCVDKLEGTTGE